MFLVPRELSPKPGLLAQRRLARGVRLNHAEAAALITSVLQELIRDGSYTAAKLMSLGKTILGRRHVHPFVTATLTMLQIEGTLVTGTHLITLHDPISTEDGDIKLALHGSSLPQPPADAFPVLSKSNYEPKNMPGAMLPSDAGSIVLNKQRQRTRLRVTNRGDRPIHVGSHFHFIEVNPRLDFDRTKAYGYHLDIPAGRFERFEPGASRIVTLVHIGGLKSIRGGSNIANGTIDTSRANAVLRRLQHEGFLHTPEDLQDEGDIKSCTMDRLDYIKTYGPTVGDTVRLGSTDLWVKVEKDCTVYGDECNVGDGKTIRDGMGQASGREDSECADLVIANALIIDWTGIYKADIGVKDGIIVGIGKAGNPDVMDDVMPSLIVGSNTNVIAAEGKIVTAGGVDPHVHYICPQQANESLASGITTVLGGGTGPSSTSLAVNITPSQFYIRQMMQACDQLPVNCAIIGKGSDTGKPGIRDQINAGAAGLKLHEDFGCTPSTIDSCLGVCEEFDVQCQLHTDSLNESGFVEHTSLAFKGRTCHVYHIEGAGGGHTPDVISLVERANVLPSSTTPTMPYTTDTISEHKDMVMSCHSLSKDSPEDNAFITNRVRGETIGAEDVLHDEGSISMMSSDSQAMGRCGEVILRTWTTAHMNKKNLGPLPEDKDTGADNHRVKRFISKYTINPSLSQGMSHSVGSVEVGKLADLVLWDPCNFGSKPSQILKKGFIASAQMGDPNATVSTIEPTISRPMYGALVPQSSVMFVSKAGKENGSVDSYDFKKKIEVVKDCRSINKHDMKFNNATPTMEVHPTEYTVKADGQVQMTEPAKSLPLSQECYLY